MKLDDDTEIQDPTPASEWEPPLLQLAVVLALAGLIAAAVWELVQTW